MIGYNPSHLNKNETLLEAFHRVEAYLKANPQYQVYQSSATYQEGTQEYALGTIIVPEGSKVNSGDVVLFSNVYYAVITAVSETTFSIETATNFRGAQGEQGPKGDTGATGDKGETGLAALMYSKNVILGPSQSFSTDLDGYNRPPQINDICLYASTNADLVINGTIEEIRPDTQQVFVRKISLLSTQGPQGPAGPEGQDGKDGNATLLYAGELSESITTAEIAQVTRPQNRGILVKDILISTAASTFGAMAQVTALPVGVTTVDVSFIGTLESGGGGGTTLNKYTVSSPSLSLVTKILAQAKGKCTGKLNFKLSGVGYVYVSPAEISTSTIGFIQKGFMTSGDSFGFMFYRLDGGGANACYWDTSTSAWKYVTPVFEQNGSEIVYYNDTEITA